MYKFYKSIRWQMISKCLAYNRYSKYFITERLHKRRKILKISTIWDSYEITPSARIFD